MKQPIRVALFDVGNTLLYDDPASWPRIYRRAEDALWLALRDAGVQSTGRTLYGQYDSLFGYYYALCRNGIEEPGMARILSALLTSQGIFLPEESLRAALAAMYSVTQTNWHPEEDALPTLESLRERGVRLGVISNGADDPNARQLLAKGGLAPCFEFVLTSAAFGTRKPDAAIFRAALEHFHIAAEHAVMIGDTYEDDILGAVGIGMNAVWITRRVREWPGVQPVEPVALVRSLGEVPDLVS
jgi:HAD superfamily hydrolase (TIGR01509 family)